jgi:hypothetical protein
LAGATAADAPPTIENVNPAAPKAGSAALIRFEDCFCRAIIRILHFLASGSSRITLLQGLVTRKLTKVHDVPKACSMAKISHS